MAPFWVDGTMAYGRDRRAAHPTCTRRPSRENTNHGLSSIMLAFVHTLNRNGHPVTCAGSRQGHPRAWHSALAATSTVALLTRLDRATLPSLLTASGCALMPLRAINCHAGDRRRSCLYTSHPGCLRSTRPGSAAGELQRHCGTAGPSRYVTR